jgi:NSS family neurotransmitter:Na+ symporter
MSTTKTEFKSKLGLIAATVGSAVGLGNVWRFPAECQAGGGAAFLLVYILCVCLLGIPVMLAEFAIGRAGGTDAMGSFRALSSSRRSGWWMVGALSILTSFMICIFYAVVTGWILQYLWMSLTGELYAPNVDTNERLSAMLTGFITDDFTPLVDTLIVIVLCIATLIAGVAKGIERISNVLMPLLFVLLVAFCIVALTLPNSGAGLEFFLKPDFSKITPTVALKALGQAFFSLSLGMGILVTYGAYFPRTAMLTRTAVTVSLLDLVVAIMVGMIVFPAVTAFGLQGHEVEGAALVFITLPEVFSYLPLSALWSTLFFLLLFIAALTSTISISEVTVKFLQDRCRLSRLAACITLGLTLVVLSSICSLSEGRLSHITLFGYNMFDGLDNVTANYLLPIAALGTCLFLGWFAPKGLLKNELTNHGAFRSRMSSVVLFIIRYVAPVLIFLILLTPLFS